jgi:hypothetical protein
LGRLALMLCNMGARILKLCAKMINYPRGGCCAD